MRAYWNSRYRPIACDVLSFRELRLVVDYLEGSLSVATWYHSAWIGGTASGTIYRSVGPISHTGEWDLAAPYRLLTHNVSERSFSPSLRMSVCLSVWWPVSSLDDAVCTRSTTLMRKKGDVETLEVNWSHSVCSSVYNIETFNWKFKENLKKT